MFTDHRKLSLGENGKLMIEEKPSCRKRCPWWATELAVGLIHLGLCGSCVGAFVGAVYAHSAGNSGLCDALFLVGLLLIIPAMLSGIVATGGEMIDYDGE